jgi:hypothetical protein
MHGLSHTFDLPNLKKGYEWNLLISTSDNKDNSYNLELSKQTNKCHSVTIEAFSILILIGKEEKNT